MKKLLLILILSLLAYNHANAQTLVNGIWYTFSGTEATVVRHEIYIHGGTPEYTGSIVIPDIVDYNGQIYLVSTIAVNAFINCKSLTSVTIPNSVTTIGNNAFNSCNSLTSVIIPNSVTTIGYHTFSRCNSLTSITIPNSVTTIEQYAFMSCSGLTSVTIPNSVTTIGQYAFYDCSGLASVTIPNSVTTIERYAFADCIRLTEVTVNWENPLSIPSNVFATFFCTLKVLQGTAAAYQTDPVWKNFFIEEVPIVNITGISMNPQHIFLTVGKKATITPTIMPSNATNQTITWSSSNNIAATVNNVGLVTAANIGEAYIIATTADGSFKDSCLLTITPISVASIALNKTTLPLKIDSTATLTTAITPSNATNQTITWSSSNSVVANVNSTGLVTAVAAGEAYIIVTTEDGSFKDSCLVAVTIPTGNIILDTHSTTLKVAETQTLAATIAPSNATNQTITWLSRNPAIATVDNNGVVTAIAQGVTYVVVTTQDGGFTDSCQITVKQQVTGIALSNHIISLKEEETHTLAAKATPDNADNKALTWLSRNPAIATVNSNGVITAITQGVTYVVIATQDGNFTDSCQVTVTPKTGIEDITAPANTFTVYPNPVTNGKLKIESGKWQNSTSLKGEAISIYTITGTLVGTYTLTDKTTEVDIANLPKGSYLLKVGNQTAKIIKN